MAALEARAILHLLVYQHSKPAGSRQTLQGRDQGSDRLDKEVERADQPVEIKYEHQLGVIFRCEREHQEVSERNREIDTLTAGALTRAGVLGSASQGHIQLPKTEDS